MIKRVLRMVGPHVSSGEGCGSHGPIVLDASGEASGIHEPLPIKDGLFPRLAKVVADEQFEGQFVSFVAHCVFLSNPVSSLKRRFHSVWLRDSPHWVHLVGCGSPLKLRWYSCWQFIA
ncbi:hypothetical protein D9M72_555620 [compost metagenome]